MKWIVIALACALPMFCGDKSRLPMPVQPSAWNPAIPQETLICFTTSPETPYFTATANNGTADPWIRITPMPTYYLVSFSDHAGTPDIVLRFPLSQCIYRELGGVTP